MEMERSHNEKILYSKFVLKQNGTRTQIGRNISTAWWYVDTK